MNNTKERRNYTVYAHILPREISDKKHDMYYIGMTGQNPPKKRWQNGNPYKDNAYFYNAIKKYGFDNFKHEVLSGDLTKEEAEQKEVELIAYYKSNDRNFGYNIANGGNCIGTMAQESKDKISKANMRNQYSLCHNHTEESKQKISNALKGNQHSKGTKMSEYVKHILSESHKTDNFKEKLRQANLGKRHSEETKIKLSEIHKGLGVKRVVCIETGVVYNSIKDASNANNIKGSGHISSCCKGNRKTCAGYHWCYEEDYNDKLKDALK